MFVQKPWITLCAASLLFPVVAGAQTTPPTPPATTTTATQSAPEGGAPTYVRPETQEQRRARLGTAEDPGPEPDPQKHFWRFGKSFHIERFERRWAEYDQPEGFVRPWGFAVATFEIYQQNDRYVWVWVPDSLAAPIERQEPVPVERYNDATYAFLKRVRPQYSVLTPRVSSKVIRFRESSSGLPTTGSWRNSAAVADMNGDRCPDIIAPPERRGDGIAAIFLGDCKGNWRNWNEAKFPLRLDYGGVVAADFNKDGHMDLAFAVHLNGVFVFLHDGKGTFTDSSNGLPRSFPTRRVAVADVDRDGYPDLIATSEGPNILEGDPGASLRALLNRKQGTQWEEVSVSAPEVKVGGDWLSAGNIDGDAYPDVVSASSYYGTTKVVFLSSAPGKWKAVASDGDLLPSLSYYQANVMGKFTSRKRDDAIISYIRYWPPETNPQQVAPPDLLEVVNIDRLSFSNDTVKRSSIARWSGGNVLGLTSGDFDQDGNLDIVYLRDEPREAFILLGDGRGAFSAATVEGLPLQTNPVYDVRVADVNRDGRPDVVLMYESGGKSLIERNGSIRVFLNVEAEKAAAASK